MRELRRFALDCCGGSSVDYAIVVAGLCMALLAAGLLLDDNTQAQLQGYVAQMLGLR